MQTNIKYKLTCRKCNESIIINDEEYKIFKKIQNKENDWYLLSSPYCKRCGKKLTKEATDTEKVLGML